MKNIEYEDQLGFLYSCMTAQLFFERRVLYYNFNFVLPCLLITVLVIAGFALPCESGEKIGLRKWILSSFCFSMLVINEEFFEFIHFKIFEINLYSFCQEITNLLAILYFAQYLSGVVPQSSLGIPLIIILMNNVSILATISLLGNVYVLNLYCREPDTNHDMWPIVSIKKQFS